MSLLYRARRALSGAAAACGFTAAAGEGDSPPVPLLLLLLQNYYSCESDQLSGSYSCCYGKTRQDGTRRDDVKRAVVGVRYPVSYEYHHRTVIIA